MHDIVVSVLNTRQSQMLESDRHNQLSPAAVKLLETDRATGKSQSSQDNGT